MTEKFTPSNQPIIPRRQQWTAEVQALNERAVTARLTNHNTSDSEAHKVVAIPLEQMPAALVGKIKQASKFVVKTTYPPEAGQSPVTDIAPIPGPPSLQDEFVKQNRESLGEQRVIIDNSFLPSDQ